MFFLSVQSQFMPFILYLYIVGVIMLGAGFFLCVKSSAVSRFFLENNSEYKKLTSEQQKLVVLPQWHVRLIFGFGIFMAVVSLVIIISVTVIQF